MEFNHYSVMLEETIENLNIKSYVQNYAQMNRSDEQKRSFLYENFAILINIMYINKLKKLIYRYWLGIIIPL